MPLVPTPRDTERGPAGTEYPPERNVPDPRGTNGGTKGSRIWPPCVWPATTKDPDTARGSRIAKAGACTI